MSREIPSPELPLPELVVLWKGSGQLSCLKILLVEQGGAAGVGVCESGCDREEAGGLENRSRR